MRARFPRPKHTTPASPSQHPKNAPPTPQAVAAVLREFAQDDEKHDKLMSFRLVDPLVWLLRRGNDVAREHAAATLGLLASRNALHRDAVVRAGSADALVELLYTGSSEARAIAAGSLRALADTEEHQLMLIQAQAVPALAAIVRVRGGAESSSDARGKPRAPPQLQSASAETVGL